MYARALVADEQYDDAEIVLETQSKLRPTDTHIWFLLAETAGLASNITGVHLARLSISTEPCIGQSGAEYAQRLVRKSITIETKLAQRIQDLRTYIRMQNSWALNSNIRSSGNLARSAIAE